MEFTDADRMFAFVIRRESIDKPSQVGRLHALSTRTNAEVMDDILQEQPEALEAILLDAGVGVGSATLPEAGASPPFAASATPTGTAPPGSDKVIS